jgi:hypothetical protein
LFGDGKNHPGLGVTMDGKTTNDSCISEPNSRSNCNLSYATQPDLSNQVHTQNETMAAGTAFAISYVSDLKQVTKQNLVVFTVLHQYDFSISAMNSITYPPF